MILLSFNIMACYKLFLTLYCGKKYHALRFIFFTTYLDEAYCKHIDACHRTFLYSLFNIKIIIRKFSNNELLKMRFGLAAYFILLISILHVHIITFIVKQKKIVKQVEHYLLRMNNHINNSRIIKSFLILFIIKHLIFAYPFFCFFANNYNTVKQISS